MPASLSPAVKVRCCRDGDDGIEWIDIIESGGKNIEIESFRKNIESVKDGGCRKYMNSAPKVLCKTFGALFLV